MRAYLLAIPVIALAGASAVFIEAEVAHPAKKGDLILGGQHWIEGMDAAKAEAAKTGKPILYLELFGRLDEKICCNNAATLRTTIFKNPDHAKWLSDHFVLAWHSVRPVPTVTIRFPDGRTVERAVSGNAASFVCLPDGRAIDVLPGVYDAPTYLSQLETARTFASSYTSANGSASVWTTFHAAKNSGSARTTAGKGVVESPALLASGLSYSLPPGAVSARASNGKLSMQDVSRTPMSAQDARQQFGIRPSTEAKMFAQAIQADTRQNLRFVRPAVHDLLGRLGGPVEVSSIDARIYKEILDVDLDDPQLGLVLPPTAAELEAQGKLPK